MAATRRSCVGAFLRRGAVLAAVMAVAAGILGMHVLTGDHSAHSLAAMTATVAGAGHGELPADGHAGHHTVAAASIQEASTAGSMGGASAGQCSGGCTGMDAVTVSCVPSLGSGSLAAPLPGTAVFDDLPQAWTTGELRRVYSYLPSGPSPGGLSISRT